MGAGADRMSTNQFAELDYFQLVKQAKRLGSGEGRRLKLALLADVSTQHLVPVLRALFARADVEADVYEAGFDTVQLEALNPDSGLYGFGPQIAVIIQSVMNLRSRYYQFSGTAEDFVRAEVDGAVGTWESIQSRLPIPVVQSTYVLPYER